MPIFEQYQKVIEKNIMKVCTYLIIKYLHERIPDFKMEQFSHLLETRVH